MWMDSLVCKGVSCNMLFLLKLNVFFAHCVISKEKSGMLSGHDRYTHCLTPSVVIPFEEASWGSRDSTVFTQVWVAP